MWFLLGAFTMIDAPNSATTTEFIQIDSPSGHILHPVAVPSPNPHLIFLSEDSDISHEELISHRWETLSFLSQELWPFGRIRLPEWILDPNIPNIPNIPNSPESPKPGSAAAPIPAPAPAPIITNVKTIEIYPISSHSDCIFLFILLLWIAVWTIHGRSRKECHTHSAKNIEAEAEAEAEVEAGGTKPLVVSKVDV